MLENQIFISYSTKNSDVAIKLYNDLLRDGYPVWIDKATEEMKEWKPQIEDNLRQSKRYVVLISSHSIKSKWVLHEGSMAYALKQMMIPLKIEEFEEFGEYTAKDLPLWIEEIQVIDFLNPLLDYENKLRKLKQHLGDPLPIQKHLEEMMIQYKTSGILLGEVALDLIEKHKNILIFPEGSKDLIEKSKRALENYWTRYDNLERDYENAKETISSLQKKYENVKVSNSSLSERIKAYLEDSKILLIIFLSVAISTVCYISVVLLTLYFS